MLDKKVFAITVLAAVMLISFYAALPAKAGGGEVTFIVTDENSGSTKEGFVGDKIVFSGSGFVGDHSVLILCISLDEYTFKDNKVIEIPTDGDGNFKETIPLTETVGGVYVLQAVGMGTGLKADASFDVLSSLVLTPSAGSSGDTVKAEGHGFSFADQLLNDLSATFGDEKIEFKYSGDGEDDGYFSASFQVPDAKPGAYKVTFKETNPDDPSMITKSASSDFLITFITPLPEYPLGALMAVVACFATFALYIKRKSLPTLKTHF